MATFLFAGAVHAQNAPLISQSVDNSLRVALKGNTHPLASALFDQGPASPDLPEDNVVLLLKRSRAQQQALDTLLVHQQDPQSPDYHKWLTPEEFGRRFGSSQQDIDTVVDWLQSFGLTVDEVSAGRGSIQFSGTAGQIQKAFRTTIHRYRVNGNDHLANADDPQIPEALAPVIGGILSLHNFHSRTSAHVVDKVAFTPAATGAQPQFTSSPGAYYYLVPFDFFTIYNETPLFSASTPIDGTGQTIAIVSRSNLNKSDVNTFRGLFLPGYSQSLFNVILASSSDPGDVQGDDVEAALDVEWAGGIAPKATIDMVVGASTNTSDGASLSASYIVNHNMAPVMSMSFGLCESELGAGGNSYYANLWMQAAAQGITVLVSSGDSGSAGCEDANGSGNSRSPTLARSGLNVNGLGSTPFNISVGGTQFSDSSSYSTYWQATNGAQFQSAKSYIPASVWNESCSPSQCGGSNASLWSGGGGASSRYGKPIWQTGVPGIPSDSARDLPDISLNAAGHDGFYVYLGGYLMVVSGTSASSPSFAGVMSLVNQKTGARQGQANSVLYSMAAARASSLSQCNGSSASLPASTCMFYDITAGSNAVPCAGASSQCSSAISGTTGLLTGYSAGVGYDLATGLGAVNVANLVNNWTPPAPAPPSVTGITPASGSGATQAFAITFSDPRGWQDIGIADVLINGSLDGRAACYLAYNSPGHTLYLVDDSGATLLPSLQLGATGSASNSQCTVQSSGSSAVGSGNNLTLTLNITFKPSFAGNKIVYMAVRDVAQRNSGWQSPGVWQVPGASATGTIAVTGMNPNHGTGHTQAFTFTFSDSNGWTDIGVVNVLFNNALDGRSACYVAVSQPAKTLYLIQDAGATLSAGLPLNGSGATANSQCTINGQGSSLSGTGQTMTLTLNITFSSSFSGNRLAYVAGRDTAESNNTGWQPIGFWNVQ